SVVMSDRLDSALTALGHGRSGEVLTAAASPQQPQQRPPANAPPGATGSAADLAGAARDHMRAAEAAAGRGDMDHLRHGDGHGPPTARPARRRRLPLSQDGSGFAVSDLPGSA